jgi:hypothetical protein
VSKWAVVPILTEIQSAQVLKLTIPSTCFKSSSSEAFGLQTNYLTVYEDFDFTTITKGATATDYYANDCLQPGLLIKTDLAGTPIQPADKAWVGTTDAFTLYFTETLQAATGSVSITKTGGLSQGTIETIAASSVSYAGQSTIPGKIKVTHKAFASSAEYTLSYGTATFKDLSGNMNFASNTAADRTNLGMGTAASAKYTVKVSTAVTNYFPLNQAAANVTKFTNVVLEFANVVKRPATSGSFFFCTGWSKGQACVEKVGTANGDLHFLGKKVIVNPADFKSNTQYNISIPSTVIGYFHGLSASAIRGWTYHFKTEPATGVDTTPPGLVGAYVDCLGNGELASTSAPYYGETCDPDGDGTSDFQELFSTVTKDTPMTTTASFLLYFKEKVAVAAGTKATLKSDDSVAVTTLTPSVGTGLKDCVVTLDPTLLPGKLYTLTLPSKTITDQAPLKNPYAGTAFTFYTPFNTPFVATNSAGQGTQRSNVEHTSAMKITYPVAPRMGLVDANQYITINDTSTAAMEQTIKLTDADSVKFQDLNMLLIPKPLLSPAKTYRVTLPKHSIRYMSKDFTF